MQIKRFEAKNMTVALQLVKNELGPEAVILSAKSLRKGRGLFGSMKYAGVEVTAAVDAGGPMSKTGTIPAGKPAYPNPPGRHPGAGSRASEAGTAAVTGYSAQGRKIHRNYDRKSRGESGSHRGLAVLYQQILSQGVERGIASDLIDEIKQIPDSTDLAQKGELMRLLGSILEELGVRVDKHAFVSGKPGIIALIGPTGVGKTTTIAKLAAVNTSQNRKQVAFISIDNYGIAANEQLKAYARIIGIPLETAVNPIELKRAIKKFKHKDLILIDTPGINPNDSAQISELKSFFARQPDMQKHLVVSVATKDKDLANMSKIIREIGARRLLFTKLDESSTYGNILNLLVQTHIPVSYLSCGRKVPEDIERGTIQKLIDLIFPAADRIHSPSSRQSLRRAAAPANGRPVTIETRFVANKNSDVYHLSDCKWSSKIKPENIIQFTSDQEAEAQNYLPCRSCNPERKKNANSGHSRPAARQFSGYL